MRALEGHWGSTFICLNDLLVTHLTLIVTPFTGAAAFEGREQMDNQRYGGEGDEREVVMRVR